MKRGRKPASESRSAEIREKLGKWKRMPPYYRPSLRALGRELGTSHQLLSFYLRQWDKWQMREYQREASAIFACAKAEKRGLTDEEKTRTSAYDRAALACAFNIGVNEMIRRIRSRQGHMTKRECRFVKRLARQGYTEAKKILGQCEKKVTVRIVLSPKMLKSPQNNLPHQEVGVAKSFR